MRRIVPICFVAMLICFVVFNKANGQYNLVPNPSFEVYDTCPNFAGQIRYALPWINPLVGSTPDYFNSCDTAGMHLANTPNNFMCYQNARTGNAVAGIVTASFPPNMAAWNYREYLQIELLDTLESNREYCLQLFVSPCDSCHYISNNLGIYFSNNSISDTCPGCPMPLPLLPQFENPITNNLDNRFGWNEINGNYTAAGGEKFVIIGNFHDTSTTTVSSTNWSNPQFNKFDVAYYFVDDVMITPCDSLTGILDIKQEFSLIAPNPVVEVLNIYTSDSYKNLVYIMDLTGRVLMQKDFGNNSKKTMNVKFLPRGFYLVKIINEKKELNIKLFKE